jgi:hypothetical protein
LLPDILMFSDEVMFHISGKVNCHNWHIWGTEKPQEVWWHEQDSPNVNTWCPLGKTCIIGPFFFEGVVGNSESYLAMLQNYFIPKLRQLGLAENTIYQQNGAPCHFACNVSAFLYAVF